MPAVAICVCGLEFEAYSGAALFMIPADAANEMIAGQSVTDAILDNFYEVMNICSKLLMSDPSKTVHNFHPALVGLFPAIERR